MTSSFARPWLSLLFAMALAPAVVTRASETPAAAKPPVDIFLSAGDSWSFSLWTPVDTAASMRESIRMMSDVLGVKRIYWRGHRSEELVDHEARRKDNVIFDGIFDAWRHKVKDLNLNPVMVQEAHARGMEVYLYATLFDFSGPADAGGCLEYPNYFQLKLSLEHPEWVPVDRHGVRRQSGPIEYCYPEARRALIDMWLQYVDCDGLDGIMFYTYCENYAIRFEDEFGFGQPIVDEYRSRYGVDIRTGNFDRNLWRQLRGEYVTQYLRELKEALRARGKKLGIRLNANEPNYPETWGAGPSGRFITAGRIYMDWERWLREGIVDDLCVASRAPAELENRAIENVQFAARGTPVQVSLLTTEPFQERLRPYAAQGLRAMTFKRGEDTYVSLVYPEQEAGVLAGTDNYAKIRFLGQVAEGRSSVEVGKLLPLAKDPSILIRRQALRAIAAIKDPAGVPALEDGLKDVESSVRFMAAYSLRYVHRPESVAKLIAAVRSVREYSLAAGARETLVVLGPAYCREFEALSRDRDPLMRQTAVYVLGHLGDARGLPVLVAALGDEDLEVRFRAAAGLANFPHNLQAVDALTAALQDREVSVQYRAAVSLPVVLIKDSTMPERSGRKDTLGVLKTRTGPLPEIPLDDLQRRALDALERQFQKFGDGAKRTDLDWGFRPLGNAILAFGAEGGRRLQAMIDQRKDHQLATLAWTVLHTRQAIEEFCFVPDQPERDDELYRTRPTR